MIQTLRRPSLFRAAPHADQFIASLQQSYASGLNLAHPQDRAEHRRLYDHLQPFSAASDPFGPYGVIAFPAGTRAAYDAGFPAALVKLLAGLAIDRLAVTDFMNLDLAAFPFGSFAQRNRFRALAGRSGEIGGLLINREEVLRVLPLFFNARRWDIPVVCLVSASEPALAVRLCDDGNLHYNCSGPVHGAFLAAAAEAGFVSGDTGLCGEYSTAYFRNGRPV
ncbi:MAG: hypothetical protein EOO11_08465 [Chitinophagaceae bacterium]|nr:MAG: hypothetical protein EOO11_08465 [Chitinophagaceae bacterium]